MKTYRSRLVAWLGVAYMATMPLIWVNVFGGGGGTSSQQGHGLGVHPEHLVLVLLFAAAAFAWGPAVARWPRRGPPVVVYGLFLAILGYSSATLGWSGTMAGVVSIVKDTSYLLLSLGIYGVWRNLSYDSKCVIAKWGAISGLLAFLAVAEYTFTKLGRNFIGEYAKAIATGNVTALEFSFYPPLFNFKSGDIITSASDAYVSASLRNTLVGAFVIFFFLPFAYPTRFAGSPSKAAVFANAAVRYATVGLAGLLIAVSVSRSNWLALAVGLMGVGVAAVRKSGARAKEDMTRRQTVLFRIVAVCLGLGLISSALTTTLASGVTSIVTQRVSQAQTDDRWDMYATALDLIDQRPLSGYGVASTVESGASNKSFSVHNFLLASWYETGLFGAVTAAAAYVALFLAWCGGVWERRCFSLPDGTRLAWICGLPALPLMRMLVSGGGSGLTLVEWTAVAIFMAEVTTLREFSLNSSTEETKSPSLSVRSA